uniref:Lipocalin n=1 Tax=Rhipicephalus appendiculatus TaxID=34631 RepID=A0A131YR49_RHIAP
MQSSKNLCIYILAVVILAGIMRGDTETPEETRIDQYENYFEHQDIYLSFKDAVDYWLYGFNYDSPHTIGKQCVYLRKQNLTEEQMNYTSNFIKNGTWGKIQYNGTFCLISGVSSKGKERKKYNSINVTTPEYPGAWFMYNLIYSDYHNCSILRIPRMINGSGCMVLLTDHVVKTGPPAPCQAIYNHSCGKYHHFYQIYNSSCKKNPLHQ